MHFYSFLRGLLFLKTFYLKAISVNFYSNNYLQVKVKRELLRYGVFLTQHLFINKETSVQTKYLSR